VITESKTAGRARDHGEKLSGAMIFHFHFPVIARAPRGFSNPL